MANQTRKLPRYEPSKIEPKWQKIWEEKGLYTFDKNAKGEKYYTLVELPYPSGDLHIGHWFAFTAPDVLSRFMKMNGKHVFFPMGFDAFGLPAENAAIKRNIHPQDWTMQNIATMTKQFKTMGTMIDWDRVTITCLPEYYKWNQWIFIEMYKKGLAYRSKMLSNWCPIDQTVLANEHVEDGKCWRCGAVVVQKEVEQWFLKITEYADKLEWNKDGNGVNWPNSVMEGQNNWIGKKEGIEITYPIENSKETITIFTTRPDTNFGATFVAIAPEKSLVAKITTQDQKDKVEKYVNAASEKTEIERMIETKEKTGVFTGSYAINHLTGYKMPIWVSDFVLNNFGTGALVGVPGHDMRDFQFAQKFGLEIKRVVVGNDGDIAPIIKSEQIHEEEGTMINSDFLNGLDIHSATQKVEEYIEEKGWGKKVATYHLHDWSVSRQRYWGTPVPMIDCLKCGIVAVPEKDLPVILPYNVDYQPKGKAPLASNEEWLAVACPKCGAPSKRDAETLDTFFDSSWYYYRYLDPKNGKEAFGKEDAQALMPVDVYFGGGEHTLGHTLYARFFTKFFKDLGLVPFSEFAQKRIQHGIVLGSDGNKMSKSKGNVINPDDVVKEYGTDTVRMYLCFMMPYEATGPWSTTATYGVYRFLKRVWDLAEIADESKMIPSDLFIMHKTIKRVTQSIESNRLNTAVASLMEWINFLAKKDGVSLEEYKVFLKLLSPFSPFITEEIWHSLLASASYQHEFNSIHNQPWPICEERYLVTEHTEIIIQVNGKMREIISVDTELINNQKEVEKIVFENEKVKKYIENKKIVSIKYIIGRVINLVLV